MIRKRNKNTYYHAGQDLWVRDFTKETLQCLDVNEMYPLEDIQLMLENEMENRLLIVQPIEREQTEWEKVVIVSDGHNFVVRQRVLEKLPPDVTIIGVNDVINKWALNRRLNYYVVNNPYPEAMRYFPKRQQLRPRVIASERTHPEFLKKYDGIKFCYTPVPSERFGIKPETEWLIDDYRNPICASLCLAFKFKVKKLLLFCCDSSFKDQRTGAEQLHNKLWMYPQQRMAHLLADGCLYWLKEQGVEARDYSNGPIYKHAAYIAENDILKYMG